MMYRLLMGTVATTALLTVGAGVAHAQDRSAQPPVAAGEQPTVPAAESQGSSADAGAKAAADVGPGGATDSASRQNGLGDIIVTAQRKVENAQRAAVAIDVVGGSDAVNGGVTQVNRLGALVPSLTIQNIGPNTTSFIRGVGNFSVAVSNDPAVAFNYDGVYVGRNNATSGTFYDLDRIEVLKGPQGTLYGRNATAGVINVLPTQPKLGELSGYATVSYGNYNALVAEGAVNLPLGPDGAVRISGTVTNRDGYLNDGTSDDKTQALRLQLKDKLTPALTVRVAADYTHLGGKGQGFTYLDRYTATTVTPTGFPRSEGLLSPASQAFFQSLGAGSFPPVRATRDPFPQLFQNSNLFGANAEIIYDTGAGVLTVIPAVRISEIKNLNGAGGFPIANDERDIQYTSEARFAGKIALFDYTVGGFYFNEDVALRSGAVTFGSNIAFTSPTRLKTQSYAPFARLTANLTSRLRLVGGIRYTHDAKQFSSTSVSISVVCTQFPLTCPGAVLPTTVPYPSLLPFAIPAAGGQTIPGPGAGTVVTRSDVTFNSQATFSKVSYRGAVEFDIAPASLLYGSVETGFRSGGFNASVGYETFQPETITAYTLGSKNRFLNNRVQFNVEAFYWRYLNQQVAHPAFDRGTPPRPNSITENVGRSTIKGVEVETRLLATRTTVLSADVQYLDAKNGQFTYQTNAALQSRTGCPSTLVTPVTVPPNVIVNCAGFPTFAAPKWSLNLSAEQTITLRDYKIVFGGDTQYKTSRYLGFEYQPEQLQPASWTSNAQVSFGPESSKWSISAFVRNIEGKRLLAAPFAFANVLVAYTTPPRTFGVRGNVKF